LILILGAEVAAPGDAPEPPCCWGEQFELNGEAVRGGPN